MLHKSCIIVLIVLITSTCVYGAVVQEKDGVKITVTDFLEIPDKPCIDFYGATLTAQELLSYRYMLQPISITVENNTGSTLSLLSKSLPDGIIDESKVAAIKTRILSSYTSMLGTNYIWMMQVLLLYMGVLEISMLAEPQKRRRISGFKTTPVIAAVFAITGYVLSRFSLDRHRPMILHQQKMIDELFLTQSSRVIIKPGERVRVIALINSGSYSGEIAVRFFDESGEQKNHYFDVSLSNHTMPLSLSDKEQAW